MSHAPAATVANVGLGLAKPLGGPFRLDIPRVFCKNAAVCRQSIPANQFHYAPSFFGESLCLGCYGSLCRALDIVECADECPACYQPMTLGVKAGSCTHRVCPWCAHFILFGEPRPTYESFGTSHNPRDPCLHGDDRGRVHIHDDGRTTYEFLSGSFIMRPEDDGPVKQPDVDSEDENSDDSESYFTYTGCPICARMQAARPCDLD
jgi:hypothetical protein